MVAVTKLSLQNIRSHDNFTTDLSPNVTVITGPNGSGKTSLIEAIYIALQGSSFKGGDSDLLRTDRPWWRIDITIDDSKRSVTFNPENSLHKKQFTVDDKITYRLPTKNKYPIVLFEPDDLRLLHGSPTRRRQFIDRFISQLNPQYTSILHKYERALKQRNNLLKRPHTSNDELFVWDVALSEYGAYIIEQRILFIEQINSKLNDAYNVIAANLKDIVSVHYSHTSIGDIKQKLLNELHNSSARDKLIGSTSIGPHRHDVIFQFNNSPALSTASRGEVRTIILALKFLEVEIIEQITNIPPLILLDDVFSELDTSRQSALSETIREHQIIITSTHILSNGTFKHVKL